MDNLCTVIMLFREKFMVGVGKKSHHTVQLRHPNLRIYPRSPSFHAASLLAMSRIMANEGPIHGPVTTKGEKEGAQAPRPPSLP